MRDNINRRQQVFAVTCLLFGSADAFVSWKTEHHSSSVGSLPAPQQQHRTKPLFMKKDSKPQRISRIKNVKILSASSVSEPWEERKTRLPSAGQNSDLMSSTIWPVLSTSLLITGNTVGAGMLVLPELAQGPGMAISTTIFGAAFLVNLLSGLLIAQVAIRQHETSSGGDVPSSFQEFAQANLPAGNNEGGIVNVASFVSAISVMVNALVLAFNTAKVGDFGLETLQLPADMVSASWVVACVGLVGTQTFASLSRMTSILVFGLFASFLGLLLPGLSHLEVGPMDLLWNTPGTSSDILGSACQLAPIVLMSLVYQNIVPTVTKMLDYDHVKSTAAITLGSLIPLLMYVAWTLCVVGGGVDMASTTTGGPLVAVFTLTTIAGSSIGCVMSLAEEFDTFVKNDNANVEDIPGGDAKFAFSSVLLSLACSTTALQFFQNDLNGALSIAGSFGSPLLYGVLPVIMAYNQRQRRQSLDQQLVPRSTLPPSFQLPDASIGLLGVASTGFVGNELLQSAHEIMATVMS